MNKQKIKYVLLKAFEVTMVVCFVLATFSLFTERMTCKPPRFFVDPCMKFAGYPTMLRVNDVVISFESVEQRDHFIKKNKATCEWTPYFANNKNVEEK